MRLVVFVVFARIEHDYFRERLADYPFYGWVTLTGLALLVRSPRQQTSTDR